MHLRSARRAEEVSASLRRVQPQLQRSPHNGLHGCCRIATFSPQDVFLRANRDVRAAQFIPRVSVHRLLRPIKCCFLSKKASCRVAPLLTSAPTRVWLRPGEAAHRTKQGYPPAVWEASAGVTSFPNGPPVCRRNSMSSSSQIARAVRQALVLGAVAAAGSLPAVAQEQAAKPVEVETITVTGSRIPQPQLESASPVTTINAEQIQQSGVTRVEDLLNKLPQVAAQFGSGDSNGATGEATVSLRNLGANRTLVLVNGRRLMPGDPTQNGNASPDLNQIPAGLVERVDLLTGGASAVYGADAIHRDRKSTRL